MRYMAEYKGRQFMGMLIRLKVYICLLSVGKGNTFISGLIVASCSHMCVVAA